MNYKQRKRTDPDYTGIMNGRIKGPNGEKWPRFSREYRQTHLICEECGRAEMPGIMESKLSVHHRRPISSFSNIEEKRRAAFDPDNLHVLCKTCHDRAHMALGSYNKTTQQEYAKNVSKEFTSKFL